MKSPSSAVFWLPSLRSTKPDKLPGSSGRWLCSTSHAVLSGLVPAVNCVKYVVSCPGCGDNTLGATRPQLLKLPRVGGISCDGVT